MKTCRLIPPLSIILLLVLSACSLVGGTTDNPSAPTPDTQSLVDTALASTAAVETQVAFAVQQTLAAGQQDGQPPADTPQPQSTNTPDKITVTVSIDTNCRTGPGTVYPIIGALAVGQTAEVVGRSHNSDNWIIKLPSNPALTCWLWAYYATAVGDTSILPVVQPPPTPTPTTPPFFLLTLENNSAVTICGIYISDIDVPPGGGVNDLPNPIPPGDSYTWIFEQSEEFHVMARDCFDSHLKTWLNVQLNIDLTLTYP